MRTISSLVLFIATLLVWQPAEAGGDWGPVRVVEIESGTFSSFRLVVEPIAQTSDAPQFPTQCQRLTVIGRYARPSLWRAFPEGVSRRSQREAIAVLESARRSNMHVNFGVLGTGLVPVQQGQPCIAKSRALHLIRSAEGVAIVSLHNAV